MTTGSEEEAPCWFQTRTFTILHTTITGTAPDLADRIARAARKEGWGVRVKSVVEFDQMELLETPLILFVIPTSGNGTVPPSFQPLWSSLLHPDLPSDLLESLSFALFGLGDSSWPKYQWAGRKLWRRLKTLGATEVCEKGEGDDQNEWGIESTFPTWLATFLLSIDSLSPRAESSLPTPSASSLPPARIKLSPVSNPSSSATALLRNGLTAKEEAEEGWAPDVQWATVKSIERSTGEGWFQDVRSVVLELDDTEFSYEAGDTLEIRPSNTKANVDSFLKSTNWESIADEPYYLSSISSDQPLSSHLSPLQHKPTTIREILTHELDISSVPRLSFFEWLVEFFEYEGGESMKEKLEWFGRGEGQDDLNDYTLKPRRTITEVMYEFRSAQIPPEYMFDLLPSLRARGFSIASSVLNHPGEVHLLVAIVGYKTSMSVPRTGVCTSYISSLLPGSFLSLFPDMLRSSTDEEFALPATRTNTIGDRIPVRFESGLLKVPGDKDVPLICVGPGTGVAPFRGILEERIRQGSKENLLFFGCRSVKQDFYWKEEWEKLVQDGSLIFKVAASRDQEDKIYVQHRIAEEGPLVWDYLTRGAHLYVCGSSTQMPKSVKKAFLTIFEKEGGLNSIEAEGKWDELEKSGRILEETWG